MQQRGLIRYEAKAYSVSRGPVWTFLAAPSASCVERGAEDGRLRGERDQEVEALSADSF